MTFRALGAALAAATLLLAAAPAAAQESRTITVSGDASTVVPNDTAHFGFGVQTQRRSAGAALRATSTRIRRVIAAVTAQGVAARDVTTATVRLTRVTRRVGSTRRFVGFRATNSISVTVRDVRRAGRVVDAAVEAGATSVSGPDFSPGNVREVYRQTLVAAFVDAREKAQRLAAEAGVTLGAAISIREGSVPEEARPQPALPPSPERGRQRTPIRPGTTTVDADVVVVFAIS